jgi:hypothetical protein
VLVYCELESEAPVLLVDLTWPARHGVEKHDARFTGNDTDVALGEAVLPVCAYA